MGIYEKQSIPGRSIFEIEGGYLNKKLKRYLLSGGSYSSFTSPKTFSR